MNDDTSEPTLSCGEENNSGSTSSDDEEPPRNKPNTQGLNLQEICQETVVKNLGKTAGSIQCRFSCGGSLPQVKSVTVFFERKCGRTSQLSLPVDVANDKAMQQFLDTCSTASFGMGSQTVTDKSYRDALKLEPEIFATDFILASTTILDSIATVMTSGSPIRAELYKLNVYCSGGFFKAHVDTPRSSEMFGSLVVSLPAQFEGGALVTRHQGREVRFDWNSSSTTVQWAAFYSDVEHEVLPVTSGHRFTLTYNLYHTSPSCHPVSFDIAVNPLYKELLAALQMPHFMREGGTLGFFCRYRYVETDPNKCERVQCFMNDSDYFDSDSDDAKSNRESGSVDSDSNGECKSLDSDPNGEYKSLDSDPNGECKSLDSDPNGECRSLDSDPNGECKSLDSDPNGECKSMDSDSNGACESLDHDIPDCALFLKGEDMVIYQVAKSVGLNVKLRPICTGYDWKTYDFIVPAFEFKCLVWPWGFEEGEDPSLNLEYMFGEKKVSEAGHIVWCVFSDERKVPMCSYVAYGNGATYRTLYQSAALLVEVPEFSITRGILN